MEIEEDNLLTTYNPAEAMSNNVTVEAIQEGPNHPDFKAVLEEFKDIQFEKMKKLGRTNIIQHTIQLLDERPVFKGNRPLDQKDRIWIKQELKDLLKRGIIRESTSPYSAPIVMVDKKTGDRRMCIDYRDLNAKTKKNSYPIPRQTEIFVSFQGAQWFTSLDLTSRYWQVGMDEKDKEKTAFITPWGLFEWNVMPFGLCNALAIFQCLMNHILRKYLRDFTLVYLDNIIIYLKIWKGHLNHLRLVFEALRGAGLMVKVKKCEFAKKELKFLGHIISREGIRMDPEKIEKMVNIGSPKNLKELRSRLDLFSFYCQYIKGFSGITKPMYELTQMENRKHVPFVWSEKRQKAFDDIKKRMIMAPIVAHLDFEKPFILYTDTSGEGIGAVLHQKDDQGKERIIACASRTLNQHEKNYPITEKECLAIV